MTCFFFGGESSKLIWFLNKLRDVKDYLFELFCGSKLMHNDFNEDEAMPEGWFDWTKNLYKM